MTNPRPDTERIPVVLDVGSPADRPRGRWPIRLLTGAGIAAAVLTATAGVAAGGWAVWSVVDSQTPDGSPAPLWISPSTSSSPESATQTSIAPSSSDDHGGDDDHGGHGSDDATDSSSPSTSNASSSEDHGPEPGDDSGGHGGNSGSGGGGDDHDDD